MICIGCGCTENSACVTTISICGWEEQDPGAGVGLCTKCVELLGQWQAGRRAPLAEFTQGRVRKLLEDIYDADEALVWYQSPQPLLDGRIPHDLVDAGEILGVRRLIDQLRDGIQL